MEKKTKNKFLSTITRYIISFLFLSSWIVLGFALALKSVNVDFGGSITFTATGINANITGIVTGTKTENNLPDIKIDRTVTSFTTPNAWKNMTLDFDENNEIVIKVNIENLSNNHDFWITFDDNISSANTIVTRIQEQKQVTNFSNMVVKGGETQTINITLNVENKNIKVNGNFALALNLTNERVAVDESVYADIMSFDSFNNSAKTCAVTKGSTTTAKVLDIPSKVLHNGVEYTVTRIGSNAFREYTSLEKVIVPGSVKSIGACAFMNLTTLKMVTLNEGLVTLETQIFSGCSSLESIELPSTLTTVGTWVFSGCSSIKSVTINEGVQTIGYGMFNGCSNAAFTSVTIPASVNSIGAFAFQNCSSLKSIEFKNLVKWDAVHRTDTTLTATNIDVTNPSKNVSLFTSGQTGCYKEYNWTRTAPSDSDYTGLTFTYNNTAKTASVKGADNTQTSIVIPDKIVCNDSSSGGTVGETYTVTTIGANAFENFTKMKSVSIPNTIKNIRYRAFRYCSNLEKIILPDDTNLDS